MSRDFLPQWLSTMWRSHARNLLGHEILDVAIVGGGINGACLFDRLRRSGYRVGIFDAGDFGGGTSSASGMMIWGGLLYLRQLDVRTVFQLCRSREHMLSRLPALVAPTTYRYCAPRDRRLQTATVLAGLYLYWALGAFRRARPAVLRDVPERAWIRDPGLVLGYEEGALSVSDARFVLEWLRPHRLPDAVALNYCEIGACRFDPTERVWHLDATDRMHGHEISIRARAVVNCAGVWTDRVNRMNGIETPFRHAFSKGVWVGFERTKGHDAPLTFELGEHGDVMSSVPWGPIALWGPTETQLDDLGSDAAADASDLRFLLQHRSRCLALPSDPQRIVCVRSGVRPLAVGKGYTAARYTLELSRRHRTFADPHLPWISTYGGKLTACMDAAAETSRILATMARATGRPGEEVAETSACPLEEFPGLAEPVPAVEWCVEREYCCTLEDYLRRRTNIAQWIAREGLDYRDRARGAVRAVCKRLADGDEMRAESMLREYASRVETGFDRLIASI